jgi:hypothetical protein
MSRRDLAWRWALLAALFLVWAGVFMFVFFVISRHVVNA